MRPRRGRMLRIAWYWLPLALVIAGGLALIATLFGRAGRTFVIWFPVLWVAMTLLHSATRLEIRPQGPRLLGFAWNWEAPWAATELGTFRWFGVSMDALVIVEEYPSRAHRVPLWLYGLRAETVAPYVHSSS